jgi:anti-sigma factor RsiW
MNCLDFRKHLHAYYVDTLTADQRRGIEQHASACPPCGQLYALAQELSCREFVEFLDDYIEDRLTADRRNIFERHIAVCGDCIDYLAGYRRALAAARVALADVATAFDPATPIPEDLVRAILASRPM